MTTTTTPDRPYPPVSIVGIGCRVPGAAGVADLWQLLLEGRDATGEPPAGRLGARRGGYLDDVESFDNDWFTISGRESALMDPQQRLALEVAVEAIDDAGIGYRTRGSGAAVVFGACSYDHGIAVLGHGGYDAPYAVTGAALSIIANRLSYVLDLHGPSLVVDSACSSSLAAVDLALRMLADDAVPFAIVGGVNLTLLPHTSDYLAEGGFLAPDGRCKPFDAAADGYTRGDGCGVVVLQRTADALRDGNRVYAEIVGSAVGSDGRSNGLYAPSGRAQQETLRTAWAQAGLDPGTAGYLECHGTGTPLGDAVEVGAIAAVLRGDHSSTTWIGSIKSNIGHLEAAAGVTGLIKTALSIRHGVIAPTIHFHTENPLLKLAEHGLRVPTEPIDWSDTEVTERRAGVSSFGFGGTNAHVVLRGIATERPHRGGEPPVLIAVGGRDVTDLRARATGWADLLERADGPGADASTLRQFGSATVRLIPEGTRAAVVARDTGEAVGRLRTLAAADAGVGVLGPSSVRQRGGVLFLFSGQGSQHSRMGRALAARYPVFAAAVTEAADAITEAGGPRIWTPRKGFALASSAANNSSAATELVQPAMFAFQLGMAKLLASWGVTPHAVAGHSLGEVAGAAVSGALSLPDAARVIVQRSSILARLDGHGAMAVVEAAPDEVANLVEPLRAMVGIAAINGPRSVVVSGAPRYVDTVVRRAKRRKLFAQRIAVDFAAHSPQVAAVLPEFVDALDDLDPLVPHTLVYSTAHPGKTISTAEMDANYWADNASGTVELTAAIERAAGDGLTTVLEIAPHPVLTPAVREHADFQDSTHPVASRDDEAAAFLACLGRLYTEGRSVDWSAHGPFTAAPPPRHWIRHRFPLIGVLDAASVAPSPLLGEGGDNPPFEPTIRTSRDGGSAEATIAESAFPADDLADHVVQGVPTVPAVFWLRRLLHLARGAAATAVADFVVHERTDLNALPAVSYRRNAEDASVQAEVTGAGTLASARLAGDPTPADIVAWMRVVDANRAARRRMRRIDPDGFYEALHGRQLTYGPGFRPLRGIEAGHDCALGAFDAAPLQRAATLDGCLQLLAAASSDALPADAVPLPVGIESAWLSTESDRVVLEAHAFVRERTDTGLTGDIVGTDQHGVPVLAMSGVMVRFAALGAYPPPIQSGSATGPFRRQIWRPIQLELPDDMSRSSTARGSGHAQRALVIGESELAMRLTRELDRTLPTERVAREPDAAGPIVSAVLASRTTPSRTAVVLVWPSGLDATRQREFTSAVPAVGRILDVIQRIQSDDATASLTIVLPDHGLPAETTAPPEPGRGTDSSVPMAIAGLVRSLQLESGHDVRLVWSDSAAESTALLRSIIVETSTARTGRIPEELRITHGVTAIRRFIAARRRSASPAPIDTNGTYVVTGGLGALGAVAVRWLLDAGAHDVVVLTRAPRPVPALLEGLEDRIVVVRCDAADRNDLRNALNDIRECGSTIRGIVHAAGTLEDAVFEAVSGRQLARMFAPKHRAASNLIELTAADATDFVLLCSSATGALGAPGQAAYAAANAAMDALALAYPDRRIVSVGWGVWSSGLAEVAGGAAHMGRAGISAFTAARGTELLAQALYYDDAYLLALDYAPTSDTSPVALRLRDLLTAADDSATTPALPDRSNIDAATSPTPPQDPSEPLTATIRAVLSATLDLPAEHLDPTTDFNELGLSSLLGIEMRRRLEARLDVRISTAELFEHPTITALAAALAERVAAANPRKAQ
ncbi:SDR family NAD(P)-dependent oxidoreductase [Nocardia sp. NBC_01009]|uniref:SDR family NAD(P)-dependent oxidoreductase n=1 Tax=Nocardia sp. NBC_01009 TaxID=2975996 RepID=UPI003869536E|nr:SDR family NAD(P)-dependent oxidoreductase [Nocardia sp. NBC_01009]